MTHKSKADMIAEQKAHITNKLQARTAMQAEGLPAPAEDNRPVWFKKWDEKNYDNPKSPLYGDEDAAYLAAALAEQDVTEIKNPFRMTYPAALNFERGVVFVLVDTKLYQWDEERNGVKAGTVLVVTGESINPKAVEQYQGTYRFRTASSDKAIRLPGLNTSNARYATDEEIAQFVEEALAEKPMNFIRLLGDAEEFVK